MEKEIFVFDFDDVLMPTRELVDTYVKEYCILGTIDGWNKIVTSHNKKIISDEDFKKFETVHNELEKMVSNAKIKVGDIAIQNITLLATEERWSQIKRKYNNGKISEDYFRKCNIIHYDLKDQILEETNPTFKGLIPYEKLICLDNIFPNTFSYINYFLKNYPNAKFYICSHYNVEREMLVKEQFIKKYLPNFEFIPVQFHEEVYAPGLKRTRNNKAVAIQKAIGCKNLSHVTLIDDTLFNLNDVRDFHGIGIQIDNNRDDGLCSPNLNPLQLKMIRDAYLIQKGLLNPNDIDKQENVRKK